VSLRDVKEMLERGATVIYEVIRWCANDGFKALS
jgi:hypothetical protein